MEALDCLVDNLYAGIESESARILFLQQLCSLTCAEQAEWWQMPSSPGRVAARRIASHPQVVSGSNLEQHPASPFDRAVAGIHHSYSTAGATEALVLRGCPTNYREQARQTLTRLEPHMRRQWLLRKRLTRIEETSTSATQTLLNRFNTGVVLVDAGGRIVLTNHYASKLLNEPGGLRVRLGTLQVEDDVHGQRRLDAGLREAVASGCRHAGHPGIAIAIRATDARPPLVVWLAPLAHDMDVGHRRPARALALISDPARGVGEDIQLPLRTCFDLTPTEARVASRLIGGEATDSIAATLDLRESTVRQYIKIIMQKTGTRRQQELVSRLASGFGFLRAGSQ